jgi:putative hemolysin
MGPKILIVTAMILSASAFAAERIHVPAQARKPASAEGIPLLYRVDDTKVEFVDFQESRLVITHACQKADGTLSCEAYQGFSRARDFEVGSGDPQFQASKICRMTGGRGVEGHDEHGNASRFCRYGDGSMIDTSSLYGAAKRR